MSLASSSSPDRAEAPLFTDGVGQRVVAADAATGELLQMLRVRPELTAVPSFEFALRERTARLMNFRHAYYARVRRVDRLPGGLSLVSDHVDGTRLSDILRVAHERGLQLDTNAALCLIRQLVPAVALLHENARDASHGLIAPERIVVTPHARVVIVEHVLGSAIEQLQFGRERLWQEFRIALPSSAGMARFDHRADVNGIGITALSLVLGRPLRADEFPHAIPQLVAQAKERSSMGDERPLSTAFRNWLGRTLQLDVRRAFASAPEALAALDETLASDSSYVAAPVALETFLSQFTAALIEPAPAAPAVAPAAPTVTLHSVPRATAGTAAVATNAFATAAPVVMSTPRPVESRVPSAARVQDVARVADPVTPLHSVPTLAELIPVADLRPAAAAASHQPPTPDRSRVDDRRDAESDLARSLDAFTPFVADVAPELAEPRAAAAPAPVKATKPPQRSKSMLIAAAAVLIVVVGGGLFAAKFYGGGASGAVPSMGTLVVQSSPAGVEVFVDGVSRGMTPANVSVAAGSHILELRGRGVPRVIPLQVPAGGQISQYLEFADTPLTGMLVVHSQPAGAKVTVDGVARGVAPLTLEGLSTGDHEVVLQNETGSSRHVVKVLAGTTASLVAPVLATAADGPVSGWISVKAPVAIEIHEDGRLIGTTETDRLMLASGRHVLEFVNQTLGYRQSRAVQVQPGKTLPLTIELPQGTVNLNASPWAEVWIDGRRVGETPIGNLEVAIGPHEIVFRHPEFGEKKHAVTVTAAAPVRLSVSMK